MEHNEKVLKISRHNPLIRIPASLFKDIDKRKTKIEIKVITNKDSIILKINEDEKRN